MTLEFIKLANKWYVDLPNWEGSVEDLEMVSGADDLLEIFSRKLKSRIVKIEVWLSDPKIPCGKLTKVKQDLGGATYQVENSLYYNGTIWLCNVTKFVFDGSHPQTLYFKLKHE